MFVTSCFFVVVQTGAQCYSAPVWMKARLQVQCLLACLPDGCSFLSLVLLEASAFKKGVFLCHCHRVLAHGRMCDCWGFLCIGVGSLPYNIEHLEVTKKI